MEDLVSCYYGIYGCDVIEENFYYLDQKRYVISEANIDEEARPGQIERGYNRASLPKMNKTNVTAANAQAHYWNTSLNKEELEYLIDLLVTEGYTNSYESAVYILEAMSDEWLNSLIEEERAAERLGLDEGWNRRSERQTKRNGLKPSKQKDNRPKAYVTTGIPGSGKSSMVLHMQSKDPSIGHHELDKSRAALGKPGYYYGPDLVQHYQAGIDADVQKKNPIVVSNTSLPKAHRTSAVKDLENKGYNTKVVTLPSSEEAARRRNRRRTTNKVPEFVMRNMSRQLHGINTRRNTGGALSRADRRAARREFKKLHKEFRFTKPAMRRSGAIGR